MFKRLRSLAAGFFGGLLAVGLVVGAQSITIPNTFTNGTVADANQVNANFSALSSAALNRAAGIFSGNATPDTDDTRDLGTNALRFANIRAHHFGGTGADFTGTHLGDGSALTGITTVPTGAIILYNSTSCPTGYTEVTAMRGLYPVGLPSGGTLNSTVGTALTDLENRAAGVHGHGVTDPGHLHTIPLATDSGTGTKLAATVTATSITVNSNSNTTGLTVNNSSGVAGTNAPYRFLLFCSKT